MDATVLCRDAAGYATAAADWTPGRPFPLLACRALDRYRSLFPEGALPEIERAERPGVVMSVGDAAAAGRMLAAATGREHHQVEPEHLLKRLAGHAGELVAVVGLAEDLTAAGDWPGATGASVGVLTARDLPSLACLVYRSLTVGAVGEDRVFIASHPMLEDSESADTVEFAGLDVVRERRLKVVVVRSLGKECCVGLPDGIICGRSDPIDGPLPPFEPHYRHMPCMKGEGCHRADLTEDQRLPAADVHATVVFTHSCGSIGVGANIYPNHIALALGFMEGTAVAVVGAMGVHIVQRSAQAEFESALADGLPLGRVVERLAGRVHPINGYLNRFGLLGDPGLVVPWPDGRAALRSTPAPRADEVVVRRLSQLHNVILPRLERLPWLEPVVDAAEIAGLRDQVRDLSADLLAPGLAGQVTRLENEIADFQVRTVRDVAAAIYVSGWNYGGPALDGLRQVAQRDETCPSCLRDTAVLVTLRHVVHDGLTVRTLQCRRCGDIWWTSESGEPTVVLHGPVDVDAVRGTVARPARQIRNGGGETLRGGIGFAFALRKRFGLPPETCSPVTVAPYGTVTYTAETDLVAYRPRPDVHTSVFVAVLNGHYVASAMMLRLS
ncbi:hypothetical protein GCM10009850_020450 [Nonomuraea monospora]|uniref:Uncharacterized protein n=1 Tax=Nonomuraea monospora TaxID=568818 RepID=A0ABP5P4B7_9ACTN